MRQQKLFCVTYYERVQPPLDPTCRVMCIDREILATCIIYRGAVFLRTPTCCGVLCWLVALAVRDIEARNYSLRGYVETHGTTCTRCTFNVVRQERCSVLS